MYRSGRGAELLQEAWPEGMTTFLQDGMRKVPAGVTDMAAVLSVAVR